MMYTFRWCHTWLLGTYTAIQTKLDWIFTEKNNFDFGSSCLESLCESVYRLIGNSIIPI